MIPIILDENGDVKTPKAVWVCGENSVAVKVWEDGVIVDEKGYATYLDSMQKRELAMAIVKSTLEALKP
jgi:hypothetical protein